ncbi:Protein of unknown function [Actinopolyspora lacussalsi subsp. righensis]|uniref:DUF3093 domain-containing protein n=1 Tax=Actinopolyspora righensis TaxID=995060 RepID=A0A1I7AU64_9ACTN|nr:Protein of unknown function [Actinopolyspora righensis]
MYFGIDTSKQDLHAWHGAQDYPEDVSDSSEAAPESGPTTGLNDTTGEIRYRERLHVSWWSWPLPLVAAALLAAEVHMGYPGIRAWLPYAVLLPLSIALPVWLSRTRLVVTERELRAGNARLPLRFVSDVEVIPRERKRRALGPELDPAAFMMHSPWAPTAARIWLDDPDDPTPYWVISTRHPERLAEVLRRGERQSGGELREE